MLLQSWLQTIHDGHIQPSGCFVKAARIEAAAQPAAAEGAQPTAFAHH